LALHDFRPKILVGGARILSFRCQYRYSKTLLTLRYWQLVMDVPTLNELIAMGDDEIARARKTCSDTRRLLQKSSELRKECGSICIRRPPAREKQTSDAGVQRRSA